MDRARRPGNLNCGDGTAPSCTGLRHQLEYVIVGSPAIEARMKFGIVSGIVFIGTRMHEFRRCPVLELGNAAHQLSCVRPTGAPDGFQF